MRRLLTLLLSLSASMLSLPVHARADTIGASTYTISNALVGTTGDSVSGTITFNSSGLATSANLTFNDPAVATSGSSSGPTFTNIASTGVSGSPAEDFAYISGATGQLVLYYSPTVNSSGAISLCIAGSSCQSYQASYLQLYTPSSFGRANLDGGSLAQAGTTTTSTAVTPEPASFVLLGTGLLLIAVIGFRRLPKTNPVAVS